MTKIDVTVPVVMLADLMDWYPALSADLIPSQGAKGRGRSTPGSRLPVRIDTLDVIVEVQMSVARWESTARVLLGMRPSPNRDVLRSLTWLANALDAIREYDDQDFLLQLATQLTQIHTTIRHVRGDLERPLRLEIRCPFCNTRLCAQMDRALIFCNNDDCRCSSDDCKCRRRRTHTWPESDWPMLGLMINAPEEVV